MCVVAAGLALAGCGAEREFVEVGRDLGEPVATTATTLPALVSHPGGWFTISLPGQGKVETQTAQTAAGPVDISVLTVASDENGYAVSHHDVPKGGYDLNGAAKGAAAEVKGTLTDLSPVSYKGNSGLDFRVAGAAEGKGTVFSRIIVVKKKKTIHIQAVFAGDLRTPPNDLYRQVLESLTLSL